jgi:drug/metabolite transporter (DMT)-like permease
VPQNIPLAILIGVFGSFCFALAAHVQHGAVGREVHDNRAKKRLDVRGFLRLMSMKRWWGGLALMGVSLGAQLLALTMAPVSVVQPVGLLAFPWSVLLSARAHRHSLPKAMLAAVGVTVAATLAFTTVAAVYASSDAELILRRVVEGSIAVYLAVVVLSTLGSRGPLEWRSLFWASGGALFYGLEAALAKALIVYVQTHDWRHSFVVWGIILALVIGSGIAGLLVQQGYATGPAEVVVGAMTVTSPVVAVLFGILVLGEGARMDALAAVLMIALGAVAIGGVAAMTRLHPQYGDAELPDAASVS